MIFAEEDRNLDAAEQIIEPAVPSFAEVELPVTIFPAIFDTPEEIPGVHRSSQVMFQTNTHYIPSISGKNDGTENTQVE